MATDLDGATSIIAQAQLLFGCLISGDNIDGGSIPVNATAREALAFADVDQVWTDIRILAGSANEDLDFRGGGLLNPAKNPVAFAKIMAILIHNRSDETLTTPAHAASAAAMKVSQPAANGVAGIFAAASDGVLLPAGASMLLIYPAGITVTADTGDLLNVLETAAVELAYSTTVFGKSA